MFYWVARYTCNFFYLNIVTNLSKINIGPGCLVAAVVTVGQKFGLAILVRHWHVVASLRVSDVLKTIDPELLGLVLGSRVRSSGFCQLCKTLWL